jgi:hypothetical protein
LERELLMTTTQNHYQPPDRRGIAITTTPRVYIISPVYHLVYFTPILYISCAVPHQQPTKQAKHNTETPTPPHEMKMEKRLKKINLERAKNKTDGISNQQMK